MAVDILSVMYNSFLTVLGTFMSHRLVVSFDTLSIVVSTNISQLKH